MANSQGRNAAAAVPKARLRTKSRRRNPEVWQPQTGTAQSVVFFLGSVVSCVRERSIIMPLAGEFTKFCRSGIGDLSRLKRGIGVSYDADNLMGFEAVTSLNAFLEFVAAMKS
jgi:hypothetical protein